jgi:hypothetical protein
LIWVNSKLFEFLPLVTSNPTQKDKHEEYDQDDANDSDAPVTIAVTVAAETATEAPKQEDDEDDDEYQSNRHIWLLLLYLIEYLVSSHSDCEASRSASSGRCSIDAIRKSQNNGSGLEMLRQPTSRRCRLR